jgi:hypothetical protein
MKRLMVAAAIVVLAIPFVACRVEKTGEDTYQVETPTPEAERAAQQAGEQAREAGQEIKEGAQEAGQAVKEGARDATRETGKAMEKAGKEMQEKAKPGDQP